MSDPILANIDKVRKKRLTIKLVAEDGSEVPFDKTITQLMKYIHDKLAIDAVGPTNSLANQVFPLVTQALSDGMTEIAGRDMTEMLLSFEGFRAPCISMMLLSISLLKFLQQKNIKMVTVEQDLTDEEIEGFSRRSRILESVELARTAGVSPRDFLKALYRSGKYTKAEIEEVTQGAVDLDELDDPTAPDAELIDDPELEEDEEDDPPDEE